MGKTLLNNKTMKKLFLVAVAALIAIGASAQDAKKYEYKKNEVSVAFGGPTTSQIMSTFVDALGIIFAGKVGNEKFFGNLSAEYYYRPCKLVGVGGIFAYGQCTKEDIDHGTKVGDVKWNFFTLMPAAKFHWVDKKYFGFYSKVGLGATLISNKYDAKTSGKDDSASQVFLNTQISLIGLETGSEHLRVFGEAGFGEQGIFVGGLRYQF
jgi:hypothetical protein